MLVSVLHDVSGSDKENMFSRLENTWRRRRAARWVLWRSCCLGITIGRMRRAYRSVGFGLGSLEGASALRCGCYFSPGILVTG